MALSAIAATLSPVAGNRHSRASRSRATAFLRQAVSAAVQGLQRSGSRWPLTWLAAAGGQRGAQNWHICFVMPTLKKDGQQQQVGVAQSDS